jgi:CRP/FNR family cyclic AMP-dependent transcriptional regulator
MDMPEDAATFLKSLPYFAGLSEPALAALAAHAHSRAYARGELVMLEGEEADAACFVVSGQVRVYMLSPEGREQVLDRVGPGQALNLVPLFDGQPNPASAEAVNAALVLSLPREDLLAALRHYPALAEALLAELAAQLRHLAGLAADLSFRTVRARLARYLLRQAGQAGRRLTQAEMAAELGTVRDVVGRTLADFQAEGLIAVERHRIIIRDRAGLEAVGV